MIGSNLRDGLRQRRHRRAFRIAPAGWDDALCAQLESLLADVPARPEITAPQRIPQPEPRPGVDEKALCLAVTNMWRAQRRLTVRRDESSPCTRQTGRHLRACQEALTDAGLVVQSHDGDVFRAGLSLEVLAFDDDPSLDTETVKETVRPTIYLHGRRIQMGQVIVGQPATGPENRPNQVRNDHA